MKPQFISVVSNYYYVHTVKPVLRRYPPLSGQELKSLNLIPFFTLNETFIKQTPLLSGRRHLKNT